MRWILPLGCFLVLSVIACGCVQSPPGSPAVPAPTGTPAVTQAETPGTPHPAMDVNITARQTTDSVVVLITGGKDAASLTAMDVRIDNYDGTVIQRTITDPVSGEPYSIQYLHTANAATVNIVGTFSDGFRQTLLLTSV